MQYGRRINSKQQFSKHISIKHPDAANIQHNDSNLVINAMYHLEYFGYEDL